MIAVMKMYKEEGNDLFKERNYTAAGEHYTHAVSLACNLERTEGKSIEAELISSVFCNRAACLHKMVSRYSPQLLHTRSHVKPCCHYFVHETETTCKWICAVITFRIITKMQSATVTWVRQSPFMNCICIEKWSKKLKDRAQRSVIQCREQSPCHSLCVWGGWTLGWSNRQTETFVGDPLFCFPGLALNIDNIKAYYRKASALKFLREYKFALIAAEEGKRRADRKNRQLDVSSLSPLPLAARVKRAALWTAVCVVVAWSSSSLQM